MPREEKHPKSETESGEKELFSGIKTVTIRGRSSDLKPLLSNDKVIIYDKTLSDRLFSKGFGELVKNRLYLSLYEACLLLDEEKILVFDKNDKEITVKKLVKHAEKLNENFSVKYAVYRDLRLQRGYLTRSGLKFGCDFIVYGKSKKLGESHSKWMVHVVSEIQRMDFGEITRAARLATSVKKRMIYAIVTERGPVYYELGRKKM